MKTKLIPSLLLVSMASLILTGCSAYMYGYTMVSSMDRYLLVDEATKSLGFKRMEYNMAYNSSLKGFVKEHGLPDFIFEYKNEKGRNGIKMCYVKKDIVYVYGYRSWSSDSLYLKEHRPLTEYEKLTYEELIKTRQIQPPQKALLLINGIVSSFNL